MYAGVLIGLGNPGPQYAHTRHNCGFDVLDLVLALAEEEGRLRELSGAKFFCTLWQAELPSFGGNFLCAKPLTFMNESGRSVQPLLAWHKLQPRSMVVIHDELDIQPGELRFKFGGGNAGHNGLKSISAQLGTNDFYRLRIGIGRPVHKANVINWVLGRAVDEEKEAIECAERSALDVLEAFFRKGLEAATTCAKAKKKPD